LHGYCFLMCLACWRQAHGSDCSQIGRFEARYTVSAVLCFHANCTLTFMILLVVLSIKNTVNRFDSILIFSVIGFIRKGLKAISRLMYFEHTSQMLLYRSLLEVLPCMIILTGTVCWWFLNIAKRKIESSLFISQKSFLLFGCYVQMTKLVILAKIGH